MGLARARRTLRRALFRQEDTQEMRALGQACTASVANAVESTPLFHAARPGNEEEEGQEAMAEQFFSLIRGASQGQVAAEKWSVQVAPDDMATVDARNAAAQTKTQARTIKITGATAGAPSGVDLQSLKRIRANTQRRIHRQAVLAGGCGGWSAGARVVPLVRTAVVVEWDDDIARCCEKNVDAPVLRLDLLQVDVVCRVLQAHPFIPCRSPVPAPISPRPENAWRGRGHT